MIQRRTQTASYWEDQFEVTRKDIQYLYDLLLEAGRPMTASVLTEAIIARRVREEEQQIRAELSKGSVYQPQDTYQIGDVVILPMLDYAVGTVSGTRPGRNPDYGEFTVIQLEFQDGEVREFASQLQGDHALNRSEGEGVLEAGELPPAALYELYGTVVEEEILIALEDHAEFVAFGDEWLLQDMLVSVDAGRRNIAEAVIEVQGMPLPTADIMATLDLPAEVSEQIRLLSVNRALEVDPRFDNVGDQGRDIWYLRRLIPQEVVEPPERLRIEHVPYNRAHIAEELRLIEREIDDEGSGEEVMGPSRPLYRTTIALIYPHWHAGTLPLTVRTRGLFPQSANHHSPVVLIDGQSGERMQGWLVHGESFVYGLGPWYERYQLPVGTYIKLERTRDPRVITVDFESRRLKPLWSKVAVADAGKLTFQIRKLPISCDYDDLLTISVDNPRAIERLWEMSHSRDESVVDIMARLMPELVKLSPQATVHAKAIYSAVNVLKRVPPGPVFAALSTEPAFVSMGGGYWTYDETLRS
ncbi:MAG TPA: hypothetical protein VLC95_02100 [Anaerolineae bacterium]|nr:hypothetical protein [Anaerolineae bacterium]